MVVCIFHCRSSTYGADTPTLTHMTHICKNCQISAFRDRLITNVCLPNLVRLVISTGTYNRWYHRWHSSEYYQAPTSWHDSSSLLVLIITGTTDGTLLNIIRLPLPGTTRHLYWYL